MLLAFPLMLLGALAGCGSSPKPLPVVVPTRLIEIPADIRACVSTSGVAIPERALTIAEVESLWKQDRVRIAVVRGCLKRALAFYDEQRRRLARK
jgi:hypothetical protein